jgi:hypothetical protein
MLMDLLESWIADSYLASERVQALVESSAAKPVARYLVLDDFFRPEAAGRLRDHALKLRFTPDDRHVNSRRYECELKQADSSDVGWDLFSAPEWHAYCAKLVGATISSPSKHGLKFRRHPEDAVGFWIHTDFAPGERSIIVMVYLNESWRLSDGALLQMWRENETLAPGAPKYELQDPERKVPHEIRFHTSTAEGVAPKPRDFVLVDQIVPEYNRLFVCNLQASPGWHSVTPSRGRPRYGMAQWIA